MSGVCHGFRFLGFRASSAVGGPIYLGHEVTASLDVKEDHFCHIPRNVGRVGSYIWGLNTHSASIVSTIQTKTTSSRKFQYASVKTMSRYVLVFKNFRILEFCRSHIACFANPS